MGSQSVGACVGLIDALCSKAQSSIKDSTTCLCEAAAA